MLHLTGSIGGASALHFLFACSLGTLPEASVFSPPDSPSHVAEGVTASLNLGVNMSFPFGKQ